MFKAKSNVSRLHAYSRTAAPVRKCTSVPRETKGSSLGADYVVRDR